jgi:hypothetical protein
MAWCLVKHRVKWNIMKEKVSDRMYKVAVAFRGSTDRVLVGHTNVALFNKTTIGSVFLYLRFIVTHTHTHFTVFYF